MFPMPSKCSFIELVIIFFHQKKICTEEGWCPICCVLFVARIKRRFIFCSLALMHKMCGVVAHPACEKAAVWGLVFPLYLKSSFVAMLVRSIWFSKNTLVHGGDLTHPTQVVQEATTSLEEFQRINTLTLKGQVITNSTTTVQWQAPPPGIIKVNWDAIVDKKNGCIGLGIIAQDIEGFILAARSSTHTICVDPTMVEAWIALQAVIFSKDIGLYDIILEGDAKQIVYEIH
jgi:hypothetical protein